MSDTAGQHTVEIDYERWGRLLYLLYCEHALIASGAVLPTWAGLTPGQQRDWMSDASEFIRAYEQKRRTTNDVLAEAVRAEATLAERDRLTGLVRRMTNWSEEGRRQMLSLIHP